MKQMQRGVDMLRAKIVFFFLAPILMGLVVCTSAKSAEHQMVDFLPLNISFGCQSDTPAAYRLMYRSSSMTGPGVDPVECIDKRNSVDNIYPVKIGLVYRKAYDAWSIVIFMNSKDASLVNDLSKRSVGGRILIGVNEKIFSKSILLAPLDGRKLYISVDSKKFGDDLMGTLIKSGGSRP
jgi:hypothetical protein